MGKNCFVVERALVELTICLYFITDRPILPLLFRSVYGTNARVEMCHSGWLQGLAPIVYSEKRARDPHLYARRINCIESMILLMYALTARVFELGLPTLPSLQGENGALKDICSLGLDEWEWVSKVC